MRPAAAKLKHWRENPVAFVREELKAEPDWWQADMLRAYARADVKRIAGVACKGPGKTTAESWMGLHFLACYPHCKVPCASISGANLKDGLWAEFRKWQLRSRLLMREFEWTQTRIFHRQHPGTWFASFRTWAQDADPQKQANTIAGLHEDYLLWLLDEASEMPDGVVAAAEAALTGGKVTKLCIMGNCTQTAGPLYRAWRNRGRLWHVTRITGDPDDPKRSPRIDIEEARRQIAEYGRESYFVKVNIMAEFPDRQADKLLDIRDCELAMEVAIGEHAYNGEARVAGVDVARFGDDNSTFSPRQGRAAFRIKEWHGLDSVDGADVLIRSATKFDADRVFIDVSGGHGAGWFDQCKARGYGRLVQPVNFGSRALDDAQFGNKRAEMYWLAAQWVKTGGALPDDPALAAELSAPRYWFDKKQRIFLEDKDDIKARLGRSPDKADGFVLTFASPVKSKRTKQMDELRGQKRRRSNDYDPLASRRN